MVTNQSPARTIPATLASEPRVGVEMLSSEGMRNIRIIDAKYVILRTGYNQVKGFDNRQEPTPNIRVLDQYDRQVERLSDLFPSSWSDATIVTSIPIILNGIQWNK